MNTKKNNEKKSNENLHIRHAVPAESSPLPPKGYVVSKVPRLGQRPLMAQIGMVPAVVAELHSAAGYVEEFGKGAPDAGELADSLEAAAAWSVEVQKSEAWTNYVTHQERGAWRSALTDILSLKRRYDVASESSSDLASRFPALAAFFAAIDDRSKLAAATRKRNGKNKGKEAGSQEQKNAPAKPSNGGDAASKDAAKPAETNTSA
jgi:hypothetical protein